MKSSDTFLIGAAVGFAVSTLLLVFLVETTRVPKVIRDYQNQPCDQFRQWEYDQKVVTAKCMEER